ETAISQLHRALKEGTKNPAQVLDEKGARLRHIESSIRTIERRIGEREALLECSLSQVNESCQILKAVVQEYEGLKALQEKTSTKDRVHIPPPEAEEKSCGPEVDMPAWVHEERNELAEEIQRLREDNLRLAEEAEQKEHVIR